MVDRAAWRIQQTTRQQRGQPYPRELDLKPGTRGHGCPRSNLESALDRASSSQTEVDSMTGLYKYPLRALFFERWETTSAAGDLPAEVGFPRSTAVPKPWALFPLTCSLSFLFRAVF